MERNIISRRSILGLLVIAVGVLLFLGAMGQIDAGEIFSKGWPAILIVIGLFSFFENSSSRVFGVIMIIVGVFYQLKVLDIFFQDVEIWMFIWPTIIIIVGLFLIFPRKKHNNDTNVLNNTAIFGGGELNIVSQDFTGGEVSAIFGGMEVDLRDAAISGNDPAVINIFVAFGGVDFKVPDDWTVEVKAIPLFGGWDNKHKPSRNQNDGSLNPHKHLVVKGLILFGGLDVK